MSPDVLGSLLPIILIIAVFWLLILRPARRRQQDAARLQRRLAVGSKVMLTSGMFGVVTGLGDETFELEVSAGVVLTVHRQAVSKIVESVDDAAPGTDGVATPEDPAAGEQDGDDSQRAPRSEHGGDTGRDGRTASGGAQLTWQQTRPGRDGPWRSSGSWQPSCWGWSPSAATGRPRLGLDLQGGTRITLQAQSTDGEGITTEKLAQAQAIISAARQRQRRRGVRDRAPAATTRSSSRSRASSAATSSSRSGAPPSCGSGWSGPAGPGSAAAQPPPEQPPGGGTARAVATRVAATSRAAARTSQVPARTSRARTAGRNERRRAGRRDTGACARVAVAATACSAPADAAGRRRADRPGDEPSPGDEPADRAGRPSRPAARRTR